MPVYGQFKYGTLKYGAGRTTLSTQDAFSRYSELTLYRKIFVKRYDPISDTYESSWQDISRYSIKDSREVR